MYTHTHTSTHAFTCQVGPYVRTCIHFSSHSFVRGFVGSLLATSFHYFVSMSRSFHVHVIPCSFPSSFHANFQFLVIRCASIHFILFQFHSPNSFLISKLYVCVCVYVSTYTYSQIFWGEQGSYLNLHRVHQTMLINPVWCSAPLCLFSTAGCFSFEASGATGASEGDTVSCATLMRDHRVYAVAGPAGLNGALLPEKYHLKFILPGQTLPRANTNRGRLHGTTHKA